MLTFLQFNIKLAEWPEEKGAPNEEEEDEDDDNDNDNNFLDGGEGGAGNALAI
jgi:hypothetical protein